MSDRWVTDSYRIDDREPTSSMTNPPQTLCQQRLTAICNLVDTHAIHDVPMKRLDELLSPHDLAGYLDVPVKTVYGWRHRGLGPAGFRVGRHLRYRRSDVEDWISAQLETSASGLRAVEPGG